MRLAIWLQPATIEINDLKYDSLIQNWIYWLNISNNQTHIRKTSKFKRYNNRSVQTPHISQEMPRLVIEVNWFQHALFTHLSLQLVPLAIFLLHFFACRLSAHHCLRKHPSSCTLSSPMCVFSVRFAPIVCERTFASLRVVHFIFNNNLFALHNQRIAINRRIKTIPNVWGKKQQ